MSIEMYVVLQFIIFAITCLCEMILSLSNSRLESLVSVTTIEFYLVAFCYIFYFISIQRTSWFPLVWRKMNFKFDM